MPGVVFPPLPDREERERRYLMVLLPKPHGLARPSRAEH
jgi:hypothetical protein